MKFSVYRCELCRIDKPAAEVNVIDCRWEKNGIVSMVPTEDWHTGVRVVCKRCTGLLSQLEE